MRKFRVTGTYWGRWRHCVDEVFEVEDGEEDYEDIIYDTVREYRREEAELECQDCDVKIIEIKE